MDRHPSVIRRRIAAHAIIIAVAFVCIYCLKSPPDAMPSEAHVFPYALGGMTASRDTVCARCNGNVNREVEDRAVTDFRWFQSMFGIAGRRGGVLTGPRTLNLKDVTARVLAQAKADAELWKRTGWQELRLRLKLISPK